MITRQNQMMFHLLIETERLTTERRRVAMILVGYALLCSSLVACSLASVAALAVR